MGALSALGVVGVGLSFFHTLPIRHPSPSTKSHVTFACKHCVVRLKPGYGVSRRICGQSWVRGLGTEGSEAATRWAKPSRRAPCVGANHRYRHGHLANKRRGREMCARGGQGIRGYWGMGRRMRWEIWCTKTPSRVRSSSIYRNIPPLPYLPSLQRHAPNTPQGPCCGKRAL